MRSVFTKIILFAVCLALCLSLAGCGSAKMETKQITAFNAPIDITAYGRHAEQGVSDAAAAYTSLEAMIDPELETSKIYAINHAGGAAVTVNAQVAGMIQAAQQVSKQTSGALDLTLYPLVKLWGFVDDQFYAPEEAEIDALLEHVGMDKLSIAPDQENSGYLVAVQDGTEISLASVAGGAVTGFAVSAMRAAGVDSGVISMGGCVQTLGEKPDGSLWNIAIMDPNNPNDYLGYLSLGETAVCTSTSTDHSFTQRGSLYHHIINPENGEPSNSGLRSVVVVCSDGQMADCLSTAMFVRGEREALKYWRSNRSFEMVLITNDWRMVVTDGLYSAFHSNTDSYTVSYVK